MAGQPFPKMLYNDTGWQIVPDAAGLEAAIAAGWSVTPMPVREPLETPEAAPVVPVVPDEADAPARSRRKARA
jgi:hypothetical protein